MKKHFLKSMTLVLLMGTLFMACEKEGNGSQRIDVTGAAKVFILNEGTYQANNSDISVYLPDSLRCFGNLYYNQNGQYLGDTGQDLIYYKGALYVSVYGSSYVAKLDTTGVELARCSFGASMGQPRYLAGEGDYVYVTLYSGQVAKLNALDLSVVDSVKVGKNPEDMVVYKNQLLVANSGWGYDNTVSVIDLKNFTVTQTITTEWNPQQLVVAGEEVFLLANGEYDANWNCPYPFQKLDFKNGTATTLDYAYKAAAYKEVVYLCYSETDWKTHVSKNTFFSYNVTEGKVVDESFIDAPEAVQTGNVYMLEVNPANGDIYVGVAASSFVAKGMVYRFNQNGELLDAFDVEGTNPSRAAFLNN